MSSVPFKPPEPDSTRGQDCIVKAVRIEGQIYSQEDLYVDGDVEGTIELQEHRLTIGPNGKVHANIKVREVVILGNVPGNGEATDKLEIRKDATVVGDIKTSRIVIEDGAYFKGRIDIIKAEPAKSSVRSQPEPQLMPVVATLANSHSAAMLSEQRGDVMFCLHRACRLVSKGCVAKTQ